MVKRDGREGKEGSTLEMNTIKENIIYSNHDLTFFLPVIIDKTLLKNV